METTRLDEAIEALEARLAGLSSSLIAAFFAVCGERLLPLYESFAGAQSWGDGKVLRSALDCIWGSLEEGKVLSGAAKLRESVDSVTPHADDFDTIDCLFAQDAVACIDAALRALSPDLEGDNVAAAVQYPIETVRVAVCYEETGMLDLGSGSEADAWANTAVDNPKIKADLDLYAELVDSLEARRELDVVAVSELRALARHTQWMREKLLSV